MASKSKSFRARLGLKENKKVVESKKKKDEEKVEEMEGDDFVKAQKNKDLDKSFGNVREKEEGDEEEDEKAVKEEEDEDEEQVDEKRSCLKQEDADEEDAEVEDDEVEEAEDDEAEKEFDVNDESDIFLDDEDEAKAEEAEEGDEDEEKAPEAEVEAEGDEDEEEEELKQEDHEEDGEFDKEDELKKEDEDEDEEEEKKKTAKKEVDEDEEEDEDEPKKPDLDMEEDVNALFNGEELSEGFRKKAKTVMEAATRKKVVEFAKSLKSRYNKKLRKAKKSISEKLVSKVDGYLDYVVEEWMTENKLAVQHSLRTEITEEFINDLRSLFENHNIMIPKGKEDLVESQTSKIEGLKKDLDQEIKKNVSLRKKLNEHAKVAALREVCEGLTDTEIEKFKSLVNGVVYDESYREKLSTIKENYFSKKAKKSTDSLEQVIETDGEKTETTQDMKAVMDTISRFTMK